MDSNRDWRYGTSERIKGFKAVLSEREFKKRKLGYILRVIQRVDDFSPTCEACFKYHGDITNLMYEMGRMAPSSSATKRNYRTKITTIANHLSKKL